MKAGSLGDAGRQVHDFDSAQAARILRSVRRERAFPMRLDKISRLFLGSPYVVNPLGGDAESQEVFTVSLGGFDCVTYLETVLAMARAHTVKAFLRHLRLIRYRKGRIEWKSRNHYMTDWIRANQTRGYLRNITRGPLTKNRRKRLSSLKGLPRRFVNFRYFPKSRLHRVNDLIADGDLIFFVSTRRNLDTFHVGICFAGASEILLRHSARSRGGAVEQPLEDFVKANAMPGFILTRPRSSPGHG